MKDGLKKGAEWNPELSSRYRTNRAIGRPKKRWEDDINDFLKQNLEEKENEEPLERKSQKQQHLDAILPKTEKNGQDLKKNTQGNVQNDRKEICNVVLEQSKQQHSDQEQCDDESSSSAAVKSKVNVDRKTIKK